MHKGGCRKPGSQCDQVLTQKLKATSPLGSLTIAANEVLCSAPVGPLSSVPIFDDQIKIQIDGIGFRSEPL